ncbi:MAG: right-handed parallel beta-helix repeat-containing protein, partial [Planctomycetaceae bacterium]
MPTYYVDKAVGNNANLGTSEGSGNAWETMDYAANQVVPGDIVYVKASADYTENVDFVTSGSSTDPIRWVGYTTTTTDQGKATVDGGSTLSCFTFTTNGAYQIFENFIIKNSVGSGVFFNTPDNHRWINCDFINNASQGVHCDSQQTFIGCTFSGNSANGMFSTSGSGVRVIGCTAFSNSNHQLDWNGTSTA